MTRQLAFAVALVALIASSAHAGPVYNAGSDFAVANPNGAWSYGWSTALTASLNLYTAHDNLSGLDRLFSNGIDPNVSHKRFGAPSDPYGFPWPIGELSFHPGPAGEYSHIRWTAPDAGYYTIDARFSAPLNYLTTTDVHVLLANSSIFDGGININGAGPSASFLTTVWVPAGAAVDFAVGYGTGSYFCDTTFLSAEIRAVPEPASLLMVGSGLVGLARWRKRRG